MDGTILEIREILYQEGDEAYTLRRCFAVKVVSDGVSPDKDDENFLLLGVSIGRKSMLFRIASGQRVPRGFAAGYGIDLVFTEEHNPYGSIIGVAFSSTPPGATIKCELVEG